MKVAASPFKPVALEGIRCRITLIPSFNEVVSFDNSESSVVAEKESLLFPNTLQKKYILQSYIEEF